jgi:hypothetical protein
MKRITWIMIAAVATFFIIVFLIWQLSIEITPGHIVFFLIMGASLYGLYWYLEKLEKGRIQSKTKIAIEACKKFWKDVFNENIDLREGQLMTTKYQDYGEDLFKSFVFQISDGPRRGRSITMVYSFVDNDIFNFNDQPPLKELINPLENTQPARLSSTMPFFGQREEMTAKPIGIPMIPLEQQRPEQETDFEESKKGEETNIINKIKKRYY